MKAFNALLAAAAIAVSAAAAAAPVATAQRVAVDIGDLDLASDKGQRILALRIQRAARGLCEAEAVRRLPRTIRRERDCVRETQASTAAAVAAALAAAEQAWDRGG